MAVAHHAPQGFTLTGPLGLGRAAVAKISIKNMLSVQGCNFELGLVAYRTAAAGKTNSENS